MQKIIVIEPIVTDRLILKALVKEDASAILHILSDRETAWWSDDFKMRSLDEAIDFIDWGNEAIDVIHYGLFRKESEKAIGYIQIKLPKCSGIKDARELGYALSKNFRKQGYMSEAVNAICDHLFRDESINRITLEILNNNLPSLGVARKCRFSYVDEPSEKKHKRFLDDQPVDLYVRRRPDTDMSLAA